MSQFIRKRLATFDLIINKQAFPNEFWFRQPPRYKKRKKQNNMKKSTYLHSLEDFVSHWGGTVVARSRHWTPTRCESRCGQVWRRAVTFSLKIKRCASTYPVTVVIELRYESSTLLLFKELSSTIFQSCQSVSEASVTPVQISTLCNI